MVKLQASSIHAKCFRDRFRTRKIVYGFHSLKSSVIAIWLWLFICCKKKQKKNVFLLKKYLCFLQNIHYLQKKMFLYGKKALYCKLKKTFFTEENICETAKKLYISFEKYFLYRKCLCYKWNINLSYIFILQKKFFWS